jgi:hypothetical protein
MTKVLEGCRDSTSAPNRIFLFYASSTKKFEDWLLKLQSIGKTTNDLFRIILSEFTLQITGDSICVYLHHLSQLLF